MTRDTWIYGGLILAGWVSGKAFRWVITNTVRFRDAFHALVEPDPVVKARDVLQRRGWEWHGSIRSITQGQPHGRERTILVDNLQALVGPR